MICHIVFESDYSCEYNKFIQDNFNIDEHVFLITGRASWEPSKEFVYANSLYVQNLEEPQAIEVIQSANRIIIHGLFFAQVVTFFFHNQQFLKKTDWVVWGGDFYTYRDAGTPANPKENEQMRRAVISNMGRLITLPEEYRLIQEVYQTQASQIIAFYPLMLDYGYLDAIRNELPHHRLPVIQIGNSGTPSNCHYETFAVLERFKNERFGVFCPMSYGNEPYIEYVIEKGRETFGADFHPMTTFQPFQEYADFLNTVDVAIMNHDRQQAIGNILSLLYLGKKVYMRNETASFHFFRRYGLIICDVQDITSQSFEEFLAFDRGHACHNIETIRNNFSSEKCRDAWTSVFAESCKMTIVPEKISTEVNSSATCCSAGDAPDRPEHGATAVPDTRVVKISFIMIVLNGMPFIEYALKAIYGEAHEIIIVEGAVETCSFAANPDGSSKDGTVACIRSFPDPDRKIRLIQGRWPEKCEMQNAALRHVTGNYVWLVDSDEIYKRGDIGRICSLLADDPAITQVNFIPDNFWKGFDYLFVSPRFFEPANHYRRLFKFEPGSHFTTHRPPTMVWPGLDIPTEQMKLLDGATTREMGIYPYHYSYVLDSQVRQKIELYRRYGWGDGWGVDLEKWYGEFFRQWTPENRHELERLYPIWTGDPHSCSVPFAGTHPEGMEELIAACRSGELSSQVGSGKKTPRAPDGEDALATAGNPSKKLRIAGEESEGSDLTQIQEGSVFETSLRELVLSMRPQTIIETGTYLGNGTTRIIATALRDAGLAGTAFYSIECNPLHYRQAYLNLDQAGLLPFVTPLFGLSVPRKLLPTVKNILDDTVRNVEEDGLFVDHQEQDRVALYYRETDFPDIPEDLIGACLEQAGRRPDLVLLDSAGHMGSVEFEYVIERLQGECYLVLDDIRHVKHYRSFQLLQKDPRFTVITSSDEKFGFCIARFNPGTRVVPTAERRWILWARPDSIGDNILAMATLPLLKARRPDASIAVFCQEHIAELYEACPAVDKVITFNRLRSLHDETYRAAILGQLQELRADICLNSVYSRDFVADFFAAHSGAQERIALMGDLSNTSAADREAYNCFYTSILTSKGEHKPEIDRHQDFLRGIGITDERLKPSIWIFPDDSAVGDRFFKEQGFEPDKTIALFAGAQYGVRIYDRYGTGLAAFCREQGFSVVALGSAEDYGINQYNLDAIGVKTANLSGATTLRQSAAIISRCRLAVGAETGLAHMACAVGTPNIIVLGGGHFGRFIPYSPLTSVVCLPLECYGCNWNCRYERVHCVRDVSPAVIAEALRHSLAGRSDHITYFMQGDSLWQPEDGGPTRELSTRFMPVEGECIVVENTNGK